MVFHGNLLRPDVLFNGFLNVSSSFHCGVVCHYHHLLAMNHADSGDNSRRRKPVVIKPVGGKRRQLDERRVTINQHVNAFASQQLSALFVPLNRQLGASLFHRGNGFTETAQQLHVFIAIPAVLGACGINSGFYTEHKMVLKNNCL